MDNENISHLNRIKPADGKAKIELLGKYDPEGEIIIRDPYYVMNDFQFVSYCGKATELARMIKRFLTFMSRNFQDDDSAGFVKAYEQCLRSITSFLQQHKSDWKL